MKYKYSDGGKSRSKYKTLGNNDCVARATAIATGLTYAKAHEFWKAFNSAYSEVVYKESGYKRKCPAKFGVETALIEQVLTNILGFRKLRPTRRPTLKSVVNRHKDKTLFAITDFGDTPFILHAVAIVKGTLLDIADTRTQADNKTPVRVLQLYKRKHD